MKQGWEYKKLGDICTIERGGSPRPISDYITDDPNGINWIKIGDAVEGSKYINSTKEKIRVEGMKKSRFVHKGDFILSNSMSFGKPYILGVDGCIHDGWLVIHDNNDTFIKDYLYYYLSSPTMYRKFESLAVGGVVNNLNSQLVRNVYVSIPPIDEQKAICLLLDKMNRVIEAKKEQLKELDNLAQAIFYDMFGDPITNEKGWEVKKIGDVANVKIGPFGSLLHTEDYIEGGIPLVNPIHMKDGKIYVDNTVSVGEQKYNEMTAYVLRESDIVFGRRGDIGRCALVRNEQDGFLCGTGSLSVRFKINDNSTFRIYSFMTSAVTNYLKNKAKGVTMPNINCGIVEEMPVILPPLPLQQAFAEKVEAIERQKELINQSIHEMQTLFDSRMEWWFGE